MKDGRQIYRMTYLIRLPSYKKGNFITVNNSILYILSISGNKVHVFELKNWNEKVLDEKEIKKGQILGEKDLIKEMVLVSQSKNEVQVMDPETYITIDIRKPEKVSLDTKTVKVVKIDDEYFLFPVTF